MKILAIDTCLQACSVALIDGMATKSRRITPMEKGHAESLAPIVKQVLQESETQPSDLSRIAVTIGPGSFNGVRVGLAFARGFAIQPGNTLPVIGISTLEALAASAPSDAHVASIIDARRGQVYLQVFSGMANGMSNNTASERPVLTPPLSVTPEEVRKKLHALTLPPQYSLVGNGAALVFPEAQVTITQPNPEKLAQLAISRSSENRAPDALYIRPPDAKPAKPSPFA